MNFYSWEDPSVLIILATILIKGPLNRTTEGIACWFSTLHSSLSPSCAHTHKYKYFLKPNCVCMHVCMRVRTLRGVE